MFFFYRQIETLFRCDVDTMFIFTLRELCICLSSKLFRLASQFDGARSFRIVLNIDSSFLGIIGCVSGSIFILLFLFHWKVLCYCKNTYVIITSNENMSIENWKHYIFFWNTFIVPSGIVWAMSASFEAFLFSSL